MTTPRGITAADISTIWGVPVSTIYRLASEQGWRRYRQGRRVFYHPDDVTDTMDAYLEGRSSDAPPS